tara:strand:+ start:52 stop:897 length:846 start_codon:yes stop_codon:yes gene_type:complete
MAEFIQKPVFTPPAKIRDSLYTEGKEYMYADTLIEYKGLYHIYPNNAIYSEVRWMPATSRPLTEYAPQTAEVPVLDADGNDIGELSFNNNMYFKLTEKRFNKHYKPPYYYPDPTNANYDKGSMDRFFAQRINNKLDISEITADEYDRKNAQNKPGVDEGLYKFLKLQWTIDGPIDDVRAANKRVIAYAELNDQFHNLSIYLTDHDEFHKNRHKLSETKYPDIENNLYTEGGEYQTTNGQEYRGPYHIHPVKGPMIGKTHTDQTHGYLKSIEIIDSGQSSYY